MDDLTRLNFSNICEACQLIEDFLRRAVLESNENPRGFYVSLPKLCNVIFGSDDTRGWLHRRNSLHEDTAIFELLKPNGLFVRALLKLHKERGYLYEISPEKLPTRTKTLLTSQSYHLLPTLYRTRLQSSLAAPSLVSGPRAVAAVTAATPGVGSATAANPTGNGNVVRLMFNMYEYYMFNFIYAVTIESQAMGPLAGLRENDPIDLTGTSSTSNFPNALARRAVAAKDTFNKYTHLADGSPYGPSTTGTRPSQPVSSSRPTSLKQSIYTDLQRQYQAYFLPFHAGPKYHSARTADLIQTPGTPTPAQRNFPSAQQDSPFPPSSPSIRSRFPKPLPGIPSTPHPQSQIDLTVPTTPVVPPPPNPLLFPYAGIFEDPELDLRHDVAIAAADFLRDAAIELWVTQCQLAPGDTHGTLLAPRPTEDLLISIAAFVRHIVESDMRTCFEEQRVGAITGEDMEYERAEVINRVKKGVYLALQPKLYWFLKWIMVYWQMDDTICFVIDIWITWIAPWRLGARPTHYHHKDDPVLEPGWTPFILENLLYYLTLSHGFLERAAVFTYSDADARKYNLPPFSQNNLAASPPAISSTFQREMPALLRLCNVLRTDGVHDLVAQCEKLLVSPQEHETGIARAAGTRRSSISASSIFGRHGRDTSIATMLAMWMPTVRARINALEGPNWRPQGLFVDEGEGREVLLKVLGGIKVAIVARMEVVKKIKEEEGRKEGADGWLDRARRAYEGFVGTGGAMNETRITRVESQVKRLREAAVAVGKAYNIDSRTIEIVTSEQIYDTGMPQSGLDFPLLLRYPAQAARMLPGGDLPAQNSAAPAVFVRPDATPQRHGFLTPEGRSLVKRGIRKCTKDDIPAIGPRAESMIRSYEWAWLVKVCLAAEKVVNEKYKALTLHLTTNLGLPLPAALRDAHIHLRWLAAPRNWLFLLVLYLAIYVLWWIFAATFTTSHMAVPVSGSTHYRQPQQGQPRQQQPSLDPNSPAFKAHQRMQQRQQQRAAAQQQKQQKQQKQQGQGGRQPQAQEQREGAYRSNYGNEYVNSYGRNLNGPRVAANGRLVDY